LASLSSFRFVGQQGRFTAYRERKCHGPTRSWRAYRSLHNRNYKHSLGATDQLSINRLDRRERLVLLALSLVERMAIWPVPVCRQPRALPRSRSLPTLQSAHARNVGYRTRGGKGYRARLELRSPPLCAHVCRKQARRKARKVKHAQLRSPRCCRSFEPLYPVRAIGSGKMETHIV
jgi:hypothetical protein